MKKSNNPQSKNFRIILVTLFFISFNPCNLSSQWIQQKLPPEAGLIISMDFTSSGNGIIGGWQYDNGVTGRLYNTSSNSAQWDPVRIPDSIRSVTGIQMLNDSLGFICGAYNISNANNLKRNKMIMKNELDPEYLNYKTGMDGSHNYRAIFLRTVNGGKSWDTYGNISSEYNYITDMSFKDKDNGVALASIQNGDSIYSKIVITADGGLNWKVLNIPADINVINSILYMKDNVIFAAGKLQFLGAIISSSDGGNTWTEKIFPEVVFFNDIDFINQSTGFATARIFFQYPVFKIYKTTNSGSSWNTLETSFDSIAINNFNFDTGSGNGIIFGNRLIQNDPLFWEPTNLIIGKTTDLGITWQTTVFPDYKSLYCSSYPDSMDIFAAGGYPDSNKFEGYFLHTTNGGILSVPDHIQEIPTNYMLYQNYPNPFNPNTNIRFDVIGSSKNELQNVKLTVYNSLGKAVKYLIDKELQNGRYEVRFDGNYFPSGIYYYTFNAGNFTETKKMVLIR